MAGDENIAAYLRQSEVETILVANKIDGQNPDFVTGEFYALGLGEPYTISASNGHGVRSLINDVLSPRLEQTNETAEVALEAEGIKIAVAGRPNVGKSTLVNRLLGEDRVVVFDEAGTTRDSIYIPYERDGRTYTIIDTAGVRRRGKVTEKIEKFSVIKTLEAVADANVVILMIDAREGLVDQDLHLLSHVLEAGRALVIAINKWDGIEQERKDVIRSELDRRLTFIDFARIHTISALHGSGVGNLYNSIHEAYAAATLKVPTSRLHEILERAVFEHRHDTADQFAVEFAGGVVELGDELSWVHAIGTQNWSQRRCRRRLPTGSHQFELSSDLLGHRCFSSHPVPSSGPWRGPGHPSGSFGDAALLGSGSYRIDNCSDPQANRNGLAGTLRLLSGLGDEPILSSDPFRAAHATHRVQFFRIGTASVIQNVIPQVNAAHQAVYQ